ncbi:tetratricopeptide repeat protein [Trinickia caryophylli]|uniref:Tetratricopeptide repeat-containing protein n=1 Tax=Trinickia caryophylli TaxID=28094 RepID=A0A1X7CX90_TRICW|nr:bacteriophage N4 adsorption protein A [Trinickia caryophylli]PMS13452.1 bacteriophage N4 adsorption protein A [Trinickia caryophylli]TRX13689.1 tetratricopeptide repeat protein [Trinickia caryophylli]WQE15273.1 tetratricopeptide repeat protein [Trinickia caryophylli]SMF04705.1 Tetratricopeptide repeat-containing protein [Trinickia caryophylli]GLU30975.1 peptidase [Trinickia caryophylli]
MKQSTIARAVRWAILVRLGSAAALASLAIHAGGAETLTPRAYRLADAAYKAIAAGDLPRAENYASRALKAQPGSLQLGLLMVDVYVRQGKVAEADDAAEALERRHPGDPLVLARHGFLQQGQQRYEAAMEDFDAALGARNWSAAEERNLRLALADSALAAHQPERATRALAPYEQEPDTAVQLRIAQLRLRNGDRDGARHAAELAQSHASTDEDRQAAATIIAFANEPEPKDDTARQTLQTAYDLLRENKDEEALEAFRRGLSSGAGTAGNYADAGYAAKRLGENDEAVQLFKQSLDADDTEHAFDEQRRFGYRREVQQLERHWGFVLSLPYQVSAFSPQGTVNVLQPGIEAYWQPPKIGYQNGRILQFFVRGYGTAYDGSGNVTGLPTVQGSIGARYKPIIDQNLVIAAERLVHIGRFSTNDWLARLGYSSEGGSDLRVTEPSWRSWQVYAEADYFLHQGRYVLYSELRYGHTWALPAISNHLTVYPHVAFVFDHDNREIDKTAMGIGPGVQFRFWFRENRYSAPASWADVTIQYRFPLTSAARARGLVVQATLWF